MKNLLFMLSGMGVDMATPNRRQAIIWTNADPVHWRLYAALGGEHLTHYPKGDMIPFFKCVNLEPHVIDWFISSSCEIALR